MKQQGDRDYKAPLFELFFMYIRKKTFLAVTRLGSDSSIPICWTAPISANLRLGIRSRGLLPGGTCRDLWIS